MPDPFDFNVLRRTTPKCLALDSLSDVLAELNSPPAPHQELFAGDVTMEDQDVSDVVQDPENEPIEDICIADATNSDSMSSEPVDSDIAATDHPEFAEEIEAVPIYPHEELETPEKAHDSSSLRKVFSPTRSGAQMALRDDSRYYSPVTHRYRDNLPIPAPWGHNLPYILSTYLQLMFNCLLFCAAVWISYVFHRDVKAKIRERAADTIYHAAWCREQYFSNGCHQVEQRPFLVDSKFCMEMERGMDRDPDNIRWLSMHASLLAEVINELVEPITAKTMVSLWVLVVILGASAFAVNYIFGFVRAWAYMHKPPARSSDQQTEPSTNLLAGPHN